MHSDPIKSDISDDETLPPALLEALRSLPSERGGPTAETDAAVFAIARETLAPIRRHRVRQRIWPALAIAACAMIGFILFFEFRTTPEIADSPADDKYAVILREVTTLFPQQIKAIITDGDDIQIALSDEPLTNSEQAVVVEVCERGKCKSVITFVGQIIDVGNHRITVRTDQNGVIVAESADDQIQIRARRI